MKTYDILISSYVLNRYNVSTLLRKSSCALWTKPYFETIVWEWDSEQRKRGKILSEHDHGDDVTQAAKKHLAICVSLTHGEEICDDD